MRISRTQSKSRPENAKNLSMSRILFEVNMLDPYEKGCDTTMGGICLLYTSDAADE